MNHVASNKLNTSAMPLIHWKRIEFFKVLVITIDKKNGIFLFCQVIIKHLLRPVSSIEKPNSKVSENDYVIPFL